MCLKHSNNKITTEHIVINYTFLLPPLKILYNITSLIKPEIYFTGTLIHNGTLGIQST